MAPQQAAQVSLQPPVLALRCPDAQQGRLRLQPCAAVHASSDFCRGELLPYQLRVAPGGGAASLLPNFAAHTAARCSGGCVATVNVFVTLLGRLRSRQRLPGPPPKPDTPSHRRVALLRSLEDATEHKEANNVLSQWSTPPQRVLPSLAAHSRSAAARR